MSKVCYEIREETTTTMNLTKHKEKSPLYISLFTACYKTIIYAYIHLHLYGFKRGTQNIFTNNKNKKKLENPLRQIQFCKVLIWIGPYTLSMHIVSNWIIIERQREKSLLVKECGIKWRSLIFQSWFLLFYSSFLFFSHSVGQLQESLNNKHKQSSMAL